MQLVKVTNTRQVCVLDVTQNAWCVIADLTDEINHFTASCVNNRQIVFAGYASVTGHKRCCIIDLDDNNRSIQLPDLPRGVCNAAVVHTGKEIYVIGGRGGGRQNRGRLYRLDLHTQHTLAWQEMTGLPQDVWCHGGWYYWGVYT